MKKNNGILTYLILTSVLSLIVVIMIPFVINRNQWYLYVLLIILIVSVFMSGNMLKKYKKLINFYDIAYYIADEREEFARIIHDEIIQDLYGIVNNLSFNEPDIKLIREIVVNLERKSRSIMMQYRNTLLDDIDILDNFRSIIYDVENLFPDKHYDVEINVSLDEEISNENTNKLRVLIIIVKELLNNIYKHSQGKTINLNLYSVSDGYRLKIISDGTKREDYLNILKSKSGVLFIKFLVDSNGGTVDYFYENGILITEVFIKGD